MGIRTQIEVREHESGSHSELLVNTLDRPGLLTGEWVGGRGWWVQPVSPGCKPYLPGQRVEARALVECVGGCTVACLRHGAIQCGLFARFAVLRARPALSYANPTP